MILGNIINAYICKNKFNNGVNDGDLTIVCKNDNNFTAHSCILSPISDYISRIMKSDNNDKRINLKEFDNNNVKDVIGWFYIINEKSLWDATKNDLHSYTQYFRIFDQLNINVKFDNLIKKFCEDLKKSLERCSWMKKDWYCPLSYMDNYDNKYFDIIKGHIFDFYKSEIRNYVLSYLLDIVHSEYLDDGHHKLDKFSQFMNFENYPISTKLKYEIIIRSLVDFNMIKSN